MIVTIVGVRPVEYDSKKTGNHVKGVELHTIRPATEVDETEGSVVEAIFTRLEPKKIELGKQYNLIYDNVGRNRTELVEIRPVQ